MADLDRTRRTGKNENQVKEKRLGKAPAEGTIGSAAGCGGRASWTLLGLRKGREGKGTGGEGGQEDARQGRRGRCRVAAVPVGVVLTRQVFFPFSFFSLFLWPRALWRPWTGTWMAGPACWCRDHLCTCAAQSAPPGPYLGRGLGGLVWSSAMSPVSAVRHNPAND